MKAKNDYKLPLNEEDIEKYSTTESVAHKNKLKYAIDFSVNEGSPIFAAADGKVIFVQDNFEFGGNDKDKYWNKGNRIVIEHDNNEYTAYEHLEHDGSIVKKNQEVKQGQLIGFSGDTGFVIWGPHLHFEVFTDLDNSKENGPEGKTLEVKFPELKNKEKWDPKKDNKSSSP